MKKLFVFFIATLLLAACTKQSAVDQPTTDKWNGYSKYLKMGEVVHILWAGKNINVGTATYGIDDNANFYVTYNTTASGWTMSETHMYAGDKKFMPLNKPGSPKIGHFPNSGTHNPRISTKTYTVPLSTLPPCEEPGFVVASHCVVRSPSGQVETAWADGDFTFKDKNWGWFDIYYFNQPENPYTVLYGTVHTLDSLKVYHLNMTTGAVTMVLKEYVGNTSGSYDATAYDVESGMFMFTNYNTRELFMNQMGDADPSFSAGFLSGTSASGTYYNGGFYYVNPDFNTINKVTFNTDWTIAAEITLDTIPDVVTVNDIAMSPTGDYLYIVGEVNNGTTEMIKWSVAADAYYTIALNLDEGTQIAFGSDGLLYAIAPEIIVGNNVAYTVNTNTGVLTEIDEGEVIIIDDAIIDISRGPDM
jgi:hypothetical protein